MGWEIRMQKNFQKTIYLLGKTGIFLVALFAVITFEQAIPDKMYVPVGEKASYQFGVPVSVVLKQEQAEVFEHISKTVSQVKNENPAHYTVTCKLFGIVPVKDVEVTLVDDQMVYTGGSPIGIYVETQGVMVIGTGEINTLDGIAQNPSKHLVKEGDYILAVNGRKVNSKEELIQRINECGEDKETLDVLRNGETIQVEVEPVRVSENAYMLGIWVRDDLAGVGTLTYAKESGEYAALGHGVSDADTGLLMDIEDGWIYKTNIVGIKKGRNGTPGELSGVIDYASSARLGTVSKNEKIGIHGVLEKDITTLGESQYMEVGYKQEISYGKAYVISGITGENKSYEIEIEKIDYSENEENKGIMFEVTDPALLELTGGIVQGMSGSPIIQNGKIIGAVTHVFVNDPTKGYGIFIENMLAR